MTPILYGFLSIFIGGLLSLFLHERKKHLPFLLFSGIGNLIIILQAIFVLINKTTLHTSLTLMFPFNEVSFVVGGMSAFFLIVIALMTFLGSVYGAGYLQHYFGKQKPIGTHYMFLALLNISMLGVVITSHTLMFLVIWEIMSLSSFFLVMFDAEKPGVFNAGMQYLILMHIGVVFLIIGFIAVASAAGSMQFDEIQAYYASHPFPFSLFLLFLAGFGMKAGIVPLHIWLPEAHSAAPTHVSAIMSGVMIKTGIFGIIRLLTLFIGSPTNAMAYTLIGLGIVSALYGILSAAAEKDMKRILAFSTIENAGIIITGIGIALLGYTTNNLYIMLFAFAGTMLHIVNHAVFKGLLFYATGAVFTATHERNIERLGGLIKRMPQTSALFLTGVIALCALPPLNGFISEFLLYISMLKGIQSGTLSLSIISGLTLTCIAFTGAVALIAFTRLFGIAFLGTPRAPLPATVRDPGILMRIPMYCATALIILLAATPHLLFKRIISPELFSDVYDTLTSILPPFAVFIGLTSILYILYRLIIRNKPKSYYKVWDCGYQQSSSRFQYTGYAYNAFFGTLFSGLYRTKEDHTPIQELFPAQTSLATQRSDIVTELYERGIMRHIRVVLQKAACFQTGLLQHYILYALIFLIISILWALGV